MSIILPKCLPIKENPHQKANQPKNINKTQNTQERGKNETALPPEWMKRAIKHAVIKPQIKTEWTSHQVAVLYPVPRKIVGSHYKQTNHAHI